MSGRAGGPRAGVWALLALAAVGVCGAQTTPKPPAATPRPPVYDSHQANPNHTITFRYLDPAASEVTLSYDFAAKPVPMQKAADGMWSYTTPVLPPEIYSYRFDVDGRPQFDPENLTGITPNLVYQGAEVEVPGAASELWNLRAVPHGELESHRYTTHVVEGLPANQSRFLVWTPPGFDPKATTHYPVLYLLHGWSNVVDTWTTTLQADRILDNLLAEGKIRPMIVVMPLGYGEMSFVDGDIGTVWREKPRVDRNTALFEKALLTEVMPRVEASYPVLRDREHTAIAGLSMGGLEAVEVGLRHTDRFASIGGFSAAVHLVDAAHDLPALTAKGTDLKLLWIACGVDDGLLKANRRLADELRADGLAVTAVETPGAHVSYVWRDNLIHFAPLLFPGR